MLNMYNEVFQLHANFLKALAHPKRLEIVHLLRDQELCVTDIHQMLDLPQAALSQHLQVLRTEGIVDYRRHGKQVLYRICNLKIIEASDLLREVLVELHQGDSVGEGLTHPMTDLVPIVYDPVCQMRLSPKTASFHHIHQGQSLYFCASGCLERFTNHPEKYTYQLANDYSHD